MPWMPACSCAVRSTTADVAAALQRAAAVDVIAAGKAAAPMLEACAAAAACRCARCSAIGPAAVRSPVALPPIDYLV